MATILGRAVYEVKNVSFLTMNQIKVEVELQKLSHLKISEDMEMDEYGEDMEAEDADSAGYDGVERSELLQRETIAEDLLLHSKSSGMRRISSVVAASPVNQAIESDQKHSSLCIKLLNKIRTIYCTKGCYFSHQLQLGKSLIRQEEMSASSKTWYYNWNLNRVFCGTPMELEIVQGYLGSYEFEWEDHSDERSVSDSLQRSDADNRAQLVVISRRSTRRPGVRYLRRGVDSKGDCANWVETEQVLFTGEEAHSFIQVRGSIPVYFSQSPYRLQPVPVLYRPEVDSESAFLKHFDALKKYYGDVVAVSLVEKNPSRESTVGELFARLAEQHSIKLEWFDFHKVCAGMHFENVKTLYSTEAGKNIQEFGFSTSRGGEVVTEQVGVPRVNCMDCLDRTNVVQAALGRRALDDQLKSREPKNKSEFERYFNTIWADNGDNISQQYSSTNALKGEFTRTQKRGVKSVLVDGMLTLSRYYYGVVSDFFTQATIDYITGVSDKQVLYEFEEKLEIEDREASNSKFRDDKAIEFSANMMIPSDQILTGGWKVYSTMETRCRVSSKLEECIILTTSNGVFLCFFNSVLEKILDYIQIDCSLVKEIRIGAFFTSVFSETSRDSSKNMGICLTVDRKGTKTADDQALESTSTEPCYIRIKIPSNQRARDIIEAVQRTCCDAEVVHRDLVSLEEARKNTSMWSSWQYNVKRAIWG